MKAERSLSVDLIKLLAVFGVIVSHLAPSTENAEKVTQLFLLFAVPYFLLVSLFYFIERARALPSLTFSTLRFDRILVPYAVWTICYTALRLLKLHLQGRPFPFDVISTVLYGGGGVQLYFLPLLLFVQALALAAIFLSRSRRWPWSGVGLALVAVAYGYFGMSRGSLGFDEVLSKGPLFVALAFLLGFLQAWPIGRKCNLVFGVLIAAFLIPTAFLGSPLYALGIAQAPVIGYGIVALALNWHLRTTSSVVRSLSTCSYGIYLAHVGFLESFQFAASRFGWVLTPYSVATKLLLAGTICLACLLFIAAARAHWLSAYLFLGESPRPREASSEPL